MKEKWTTLAVCIAVPVLLGISAGFLTADSMETFAMLEKPFLSPPGFLFPIVWTVLYVLMGISSYLVITSGAARQEILPALVLYGIQLAMNVIWPILFFRLGWYGISFVWLVLLWAVIYAYTTEAFHISRAAAALMVPYLIWVAFAGYLNLGIALLN